MQEEGRSVCLDHSLRFLFVLAVLLYEFLYSLIVSLACLSQYFGRRPMLVARASESSKVRDVLRIFTHAHGYGRLYLDGSGRLLTIGHLRSKSASITLPSTVPSSTVHDTNR